MQVICPQCGTVSIVDEDALVEGEDPIPCLAPTGFEWKLPTGKITPVVGEAIYISATGEHLSREAYIEKYKLDPEIAYTKMRERSGYEKRAVLERAKGR
jgi:hypothetical protein